MRLWEPRLGNTCPRSLLPLWAPAPLGPGLRSPEPTTQPPELTAARAGTRRVTGRHLGVLSQVQEVSAAQSSLAEAPGRIRTHQYRAATLPVPATHPPPRLAGAQQKAAKPHGPRQNQGAVREGPAHLERPWASQTWGEGGNPASLLITATVRGGILAIPILQMRRLRLTKVKQHIKALTGLKGLSWVLSVSLQTSVSVLPPTRDTARVTEPGVQKLAG